MSSILQRGCSFGRRSLALVPRYVLLQNPKGAPKRCISTVNAKTKAFGPISVFLLVVPCGTFCLGTWQYQRRKWKLNLIAELEARTSAPPVEFPEDLNDLEDLEYKRVRLRGTFDHSKEIFMGPRPLLVGGDVYEGGSGLISSGQSGYLVLTPFKFADRDLTILVNRGWVSRKQRKAETRQEGQLDGVVELTAVVRKTENRAPFMPDNSKGSLLFTFRDVERMSQMTGTAPICVDAVDTFPGGPQGGQTRVTLRNEHLSYMFTWYSLSLATAYMWYHRFLRGKPLM
ncbi:surfeit locus protein 1 [Macrobrachium rosenbergii]|uniref:surfeit locus protein 1 n=1 Tax=Macrobrachium rosenbergii TaxID=79674 RepID=UPI0034D48E06